MIKPILVFGIVGISLVSVAMPSRSELKGVQSLVNELMAGDIQAMKSGKLPPAKVAANAEAYACDAETEAAKFLLLKGAFGLYIQGEEYDEALRVLNKLTATVRGVPDKVMAEIVFAKLKRVSKKKGMPIFEYYERLELRMNMSEERAKLEKALKENPRSREIHHDLGVCLAVLGDWPKALGHFAQAGGKESEAAKAEQSGKAVTAADLWWACAQGDSEDAFKSHAATLYRKALADGKLAGLKLTLAKKRMTEFESAAAASVAEPKKPKVFAAPTKESTPSKPNVIQRQSAAKGGKYDWSIPNHLDGVKTLDFDLGGREKMTFFAVPPGTCDNMCGIGVRPYRITHPFWVSQFPVTLAQFKAMGYDCKVGGIDDLVRACKNDPEVAVLASTTHSERCRFYDDLNSKYGHLLPKGLVFRPLTISELSLLRKMEFCCIVRSEELLAALHKKGFFTDFTEEWKASDSAREVRMFTPRILLPIFGKCKAMKKVVAPDCGEDSCLDCIVTTKFSGWDKTWGMGDEVKYEGNKILRNGMKDNNPFFYCDINDDQARVRFYSGWMQVRQLRGCHWRISVAVGHDYVGEWKREHGK